MKVMRGAASSIVAALTLVGGQTESLQAAEAATCNENWYLCINETEEIDGYFARTYAEQKCNVAWVQCVKNQAFGA